MAKLRIYRLGLSQMSNLMDPRNPIFLKNLISQGASEFFEKSGLSRSQ